MLHDAWIQEPSSVRSATQLSPASGEYYDCCFLGFMGGHAAVLCMKRCVGIGLVGDFYTG